MKGLTKCRLSRERACLSVWLGLRASSIAFACEVSQTPTHDLLPPAIHRLASAHMSSLTVLTDTTLDVGMYTGALVT